MASLQEGVACWARARAANPALAAVHGQAEPCRTAHHPHPPLPCRHPQLGGLALHEGRVAEMATGEGKTLVASLPAYVNALTGGVGRPRSADAAAAPATPALLLSVERRLGLRMPAACPNAMPLPGCPPPCRQGRAHRDGERLPGAPRRRVVRAAAAAAAAVAAVLSPARPSRGVDRPRLLLCSALLCSAHAACPHSRRVGKVFRFLGLGVGVLTDESSTAERQAALAQDVTYTTGGWALVGWVGTGSSRGLRGARLALVSAMRRAHATARRPALLRPRSRRPGLYLPARLHGHLARRHREQLAGWVAVAGPDLRLEGGGRGVQRLQSAGALPCRVDPPAGARSLPPHRRPRPRCPRPRSASAARCTARWWTRWTRCSSVRPCPAPLRCAALRC